MENLYSMTGYGRSESTIADKIYIIEIKTLNGKQFDLNFKLPPLLKPFEVQLRTKLQNKLQRGTVECTIYLKSSVNGKASVINETLLMQYYNQLLELGKKNQTDMTGVMAALLRLPEIVIPATDTIDEVEFNLVDKAIDEVIAQNIKHRLNEGLPLQNDLLKRIENINKKQTEIALLEHTRIVDIKESLLAQIRESNIENFDNNKLEQELIFYIEKLDIHEEQSRLSQHCIYFKEIINNSEITKGKKLSFVLQEMGREINTIGSKAYHSQIQKYVVDMKDELEKAKEQVNNAL